MPEEWAAGRRMDESWAQRQVPSWPQEPRGERAAAGLTHRGGGRGGEALFWDRGQPVRPLVRLTLEAANQSLRALHRLPEGPCWAAWR